MRLFVSFCVLSAVCVLCLGTEAAAREVTVRTREEIVRALQQAQPGDEILIAPGTYAGGLQMRERRGTREMPIVLRPLDPAQSPVFDQGGRGGSILQFSQVNHLEVRGLTLQNVAGNGLNIDDGGASNPPSEWITIDGLIVRDILPGNNDAIKLSGLTNFRVTNCRIERWADGGSAVDMVGCREGLIEGNQLEGRSDDVQGDGLRVKGGGSRITFRRNILKHPHGRGIQVGGSTGLPYFRPPARVVKAEAADCLIEENLIIGGQAAISFASSDGGLVRRNTILHPKKWPFRILREDQNDWFVPTRGGVVERNLIVFGDAVPTAVNVGSGTDAQSFRFRENWWYNTESPRRSKLSLPVEETDGVHGTDPGLDSDGRHTPNSPAREYGAPASKLP